MSRGLVTLRYNSLMEVGGRNDGELCLRVQLVWGLDRVIQRAAIRTGVNPTHADQLTETYVRRLCRDWGVETVKRIRTDQAILDRLHGAEVYLGDDV